jgi:lipopolysaccharide exporter
MLTITRYAELAKSMARTFLDGKSLKAQMARGGIWLGIGGGSESGARFLRNIILARILAPEAFGLIAIVMAINNFFETFTYVGMKEAVIQNPRGDERQFQNGAFLVSMVRSAILFCIAIAAVPFIAGFYHKPDLTGMLRLSFLNVLLLGAISPAAYASLKHMNYRTWTFINHGGSFVGVLVTIVLGIIMKNAWALVLGFLCESLFRTVFSYILSPYVPSFKSDSDSLRSLMQFSKGIFGLPLLQFLYQRIDIFVLGKMVTDGQLGVYNLAISLAYIPYTIFEMVMGQLLLPMFSTIQNDVAQLGAAYTRVTKIVILIFFPFAALLACFASPLLNLAYGKAYTGASTVFQVLTISLGLRMVGLVSSSVFFALGKPSLFRFSTIMRFVVIAAAIVPFIKMFGTVGAALANGIALLVWIILIQRMLKKTIGLSYAAQIRPLVPGCAVSGVILAVYFLFIFIR